MRAQEFLESVALTTFVLFPKKVSESFVEIKWKQRLWHREGVEGKLSRIRAFMGGNNVKKYLSVCAYIHTTRLSVISKT